MLVHQFGSDDDQYQKLHGFAAEMLISFFFSFFFQQCDLNPCATGLHIVKNRQVIRLSVGTQAGFSLPGLWLLTNRSPQLNSSALGQRSPRFPSRDIDDIWIAVKQIKQVFIENAGFFVLFSLHKFNEMQILKEHKSKRFWILNLLSGKKNRPSSDTSQSACRPESPEIYIYLHLCNALST